jgi:hypothetical protein
VPDATGPQYTITRRSAGWEFTFCDGNGAVERDVFRDVAGTKAVVYLLQSPGRTVTPAASLGKDAPEANVHMGSDVDVDDVGIKDMERTCKQLIADIEKAKQEGLTRKAAEDAQQLATIQATVERAKKDLKHGSYLKNGSRISKKKHGGQQSARVTVVRGFGEFLEDAGQRMPQFQMHLKKFCHVGTECIYDPQPPVCWEIR